jgi:methionine biosynthesis protein MetW
LDLGCGDGQLLQRLMLEKDATVEGVEMDERGIMQCVEKGVSVFHSDIESWILDYPENSFDYVILNQSMQEVKNVDAVLTQALKIGKKVIVGFPNFAYWTARMCILFLGKVPITRSLPYSWFDTPNIHFLSIKDFEEYCHQKNIEMFDSFYVGEKVRIKIFLNLFAQNAIFIVRKK